MDVVVIRALAGLLPAGTLLVGSSAMYLKTRTSDSLLQLVGAGCLVLVCAAHVCEGLGLLPWMGWGEPRSPGHYFDLSCALAGIALFPVGYLMHTLRTRKCAAAAPSDTVPR